MIHKPTRREFLKYGVKAGILTLGVPTLLKFMETEAHAAFTFISSTSHTVDAAGTAMDAAASLNVAAGDLLVAWCKHEGTNGTFAVAKDSGSPANTFTFDAGDEVNHSNNDLNGSFGYVLSAAADATAKFRLTTASKPFRRFIVMQFRPDAGETVTKDTAATGQGSSTTPTSGAITTTGTDEIVCGGYGEYSASTTTSEQINGVAATEPAASNPGGAYTSCWYRILTSTFSSGTASASITGSAAWICNVIAFKSAAAGAAPRQPIGPFVFP